MIDARSFAYTHLSNYKNNREGNHLLITKRPSFHDLRTRWCMLCSDTFKRSCLKQNEIFRYYFVLGEVNGIVLAEPYPLVLMPKSREFTFLCLVNPSIRKYVKIPSHYPVDEPLDRWRRIGLGFDSLDDDYKVLAMAFSYPYYTAAKVYSLRYGRWKSIAPPTQPGTFRRDLTFFLRGRLHWIGDHLIHSFNVHDEKFGYIKLPAETVLLGNVIKLIRFPGDGGDSLGMLESVWNGISIWVMRDYGVADSWMMTSTLKGFQHVRGDFLHQKRNGELLFGMVSRGKKSYSRRRDNDADGLMEDDRSRDGVRVFDIPTSSCVKHLAEAWTPENGRAIDYVESLALLSEGISL